MSDDQDGCEWLSVSSGTGYTRVVLDQRPLNGCVCSVFGTISGKSLKSCHQMSFLKVKCTKFDFGWGSAPDPAGELTALPRHPGWI